MADTAVQFLSYAFFYREDENGNYITPVRHAEGSVSFGSAHDTILDYEHMYHVWFNAFSGTGYDTMLWGHTVLMTLCTLSRLIDGTFTDFASMQCYDNFVADIYLEQPEGIYAEVDLFTWPGVMKGHLFLILNSAYIIALEYGAIYAIMFFWYVGTWGGKSYGAFH